MKRRPLALVSLASLLAACQGAPPVSPMPRPLEMAPAPPPAPPARAPSVIELTVTYREAANAFEILDNVSMWLEDKCDPEYRAYWQKRFGITAADEQRFAAYEQVRARHYPKAPEDARGPLVFVPGKPADRLAEAFYGAATISEALATVATFATPEETAALRDFFAAYAGPLGDLLGESQGLPAIGAALQLNLDRSGAAAFADELARFYGVAERSRFTVLPVWWPPIEHTSANKRGPFLLLKYHPGRHGADEAKAIDIPIHELAHHLSSRRSLEQTAPLAKVFVERCPLAARLSGPRLLEEPLAVAAQKTFASRVDPEHYQVAGAWYGDPWASAMSKLIFPEVKRAIEGGKPLDAALMKTAGKACTELLALAKALDDKAPGR